MAMAQKLKWWQKEVKWGLFVKLFIALNFFALTHCYRLALVGYWKDTEEEEYKQYLKDRIEIQSQLIDLQQKIIDMKIEECKYLGGKNNVEFRETE